jgi:mono/diheme cytochrome c family protein
MRRFGKIAGYVVGAMAALLMVGYGTAHMVSDRRLSERFDMILTTVFVPDDEAAIEWGGHLVNAVTACQDCHGPDLAGTVMSDDAAAVLVAPNLTPGKGGVGATLTDADWVRAIRHGVRSDGSSLLVMPSYAYARMSDRDLGAMIAYLKTLPPVDHELPAFRLRPLGRALVAAGAFNDEFVARKIAAEARYEEVEPGLSLEYGEYLATISGCISCHRADLKGGPAGPPEAPPASDISPAALANWDQADFFRAMREGRRPDGSEISEFMPWPVMRQMKDEELSAIWLYLQSVSSD